MGIESKIFADSSLTKKSVNDAVAGNRFLCKMAAENSSTVFTRISAAALIYFFAPQMRRLFEGGAYLNIVPDKFTFSIYIYSTVHFLSVNFPMG